MYRNLAKMTTSTVGTGTITLASAVPGFLSLADAGYIDSELVTFMIEDGDNREISKGKYTASGTTLTRNIVLASTNSGSKISLSGNAIVFIGLSANDIYNIDPNSRILLQDEFASGSIETGEIGSLGWIFLTGSIANSGYATNHPGAFAHTNNSATQGYLTTEKAVAACGDVEEIVFIIKLTNPTNTNAEFRCGLLDTLLTYTNANGVCIEYLTGDTSVWGAVFNGGNGNKTRTASPLITFDTDWHKYKIRRVSSSNWAFSVDDGTEISITSGNLPDDSDTGYLVMNNTNSIGTGPNILSIDYVHLKLLPMSR